MIVRGCDFPEDRYYHADINVWLKQEAPGVLLLGATSFGVALAVEFVAFLPKPSGTQVEAGRAVGLLELSKNLLRRGVAAALPSGPRGRESGYGFMRHAVEHGAKFFACSEAMQEHDLARADLIEEVCALGGAAAFIGRTLDEEWATLVY